MLDTFNKRLEANLFDLRESRGKIGCPAALLNPGTSTPRLECIHVCGVLCPDWMSANKFCGDGCKIGNCPCVSFGISFGMTVTKNTFWEYIDRVIVQGV